MFNSPGPISTAALLVPQDKKTVPKPKKAATSQPSTSAKPSQQKSRGSQPSALSSGDGVNGDVSSSSRPDVPDPTEMSGFQKGWGAEEILGATEMEGQILFLIKW